MDNNNMMVAILVDRTCKSGLLVLSIYKLTGPHLYTTLIKAL